MREAEYIEKRRLEIAEELGIPVEKVEVLPYRPPADYPDPTPLRIKLEKIYMEWADRSGVPVEELGDYITHDVVYSNPFKGGQYWLTTLRST